MPVYIIARGRDLTYQVVEPRKGTDPSKVRPHKFTATADPDDTMLRLFQPDGTPVLMSDGKTPKVRKSGIAMSAEDFGAWMTVWKEEHADDLTAIAESLAAVTPKSDREAQYRTAVYRFFLDDIRANGVRVPVESKTDDGPTPEQKRIAAIASALGI